MRCIPIDDQGLVREALLPLLRIAFLCFTVGNPVLIQQLAEIREVVVAVGQAVDNHVFRVSGIFEILRARDP
jgi:hypothetical protein